jgi:RNA polymerase primary sigma factor
MSRTCKSQTRSTLLDPILDRHPPLSREEETALARRAASGDRRARELLMLHNLRLVLSVARRYTGPHAPIEDLIQEGSCGLAKAVDQFDVTQGLRFSTYAVWWIRALVRAAALSAPSAVRRPTTWQVAAARDLSLHAPLRDGENATLLDSLRDEAAGPEEQAARAETSRSVRSSLARARRKIGPLGWSIVHQRLTREDPVPRRDVGRRFGLSGERVRQVEAVTRAVLAEYLAGEVA